MDIEISDTIKDMDEREWESLAGTDIERSHGWYRTIEDSGVRMHYVFVRERGTLAAAACSYVSEERMYIRLPLLEVRSPLGTSLAFFSHDKKQAHALLGSLEEIRIREGAKGMAIVDLRRDEFTSIRNQVERFTGFPLSENTYLDLNFDDFEQYLSSISATKRRSIRITLNKEKRLGIKSCLTREFSEWKGEAHKLQGYLCEKYKDYRWHLPERFYEALEKNLKDRAEMLLFFKDDILLAFAVSLNTPEISLYKFAGVDPQYRGYQAYFLIYYEGIKRAIEKGQKRIYFGPSAYEFKEKIGCKREEIFGLVWLGNPLLNGILKSYLEISELSGRRF